MTVQFPKGFAWGAATSAYQVEGAWDADAKGPSVWDDLCRLPGGIVTGDTGDVACDHYHRFREDVALMRAMGLKAYRFSISWPRVLPLGEGAVNERGLGFYSDLVDELLRAGIEPWVTLFHWDYPLALHRKGSWLNPSSPAWFEAYARVVVDRLSDRVTRWITLNEPHIFLGPSELEGFHPPGNRLSHAERLLAAHHALLAHGRAVRAIRERAKRPPTVGWAPIGRAKAPCSVREGGRLDWATPDARDIEAARLATHAVGAKDFWNNAWLADPVVLGRYPEDGLALYGTDSPRVNPGDMELIAQPLDFYGINVYDAELIGMGEDGRPVKRRFPPGHPQNALRWNVIPEALYWCPRWLFERYKVPIVVTENGMTGLDWVDLDGRVRDFARIDYTRRYLLQLSRAIGDGADVRGYFHWSLLDNMEWQHGYKERFGLVHVDFTTLARTPKDSSRWYRRVIETNGASLLEPADAWA